MYEQLFFYFCHCHCVTCCGLSACLINEDTYKISCLTACMRAVGAYHLIRVGQYREVFPVFDDDIENRFELRLVQIRKSGSGTTWRELCRHVPTVHKRTQETYTINLREALI